MDKRENICAVVVTYNRKNLLLECLESLLKQTYPLDAVYIIDNASIDGTPELLIEKGYISNLLNPLNGPLENENEINMLSDRNKDKRIKIYYVRMNENSGGAGGFYEGTKRGHECGYDWLWLMDDDVEAKEDALEVLLNYGRKSGVLIPIKVSKKTLEIKDWSAIIYDLSNPFKVNPKTPLFKKYTLLNELPDILEVQDFSFEGPLIHKSVIERVKYPKKEFFIYADDTEYALRIKRTLRIQLLLIKKALIFKDIEVKPFTNIFWKDYYYKRNLFWIHKIYGKNLFVRYLNPILLFFFVAIIKGFLNGNLNKIKIVYFALADAFCNNFINRFLPDTRNN